MTSPILLFKIYEPHRIPERSAIGASTGAGQLARPATARGSETAHQLRQFDLARTHAAVSLIKHVTPHHNSNTPHPKELIKSDFIDEIRLIL